MKTSSIIKELQWCVDRYGDRELQYMGIKRTLHDTVFIEEVTTIHATLIKVNKKHIAAPNEPFIICGDSGNEYIYEKFIKLNWFGRLIKKYITQ